MWFSSIGVQWLAGLWGFASNGVVNLGIGWQQWRPLYSGLPTAIMLCEAIGLLQITQNFNISNSLIPARTFPNVWVIRILRCNYSHVSQSFSQMVPGLLDDEQSSASTSVLSAVMHGAKTKWSLRNTRVNFSLLTFLSISQREQTRNCLACSSVELNSTKLQVK